MQKPLIFIAFSLFQQTLISKAMTSGYYQNPELNQELFTQDGWINTGDLGFLDNGALTITGREKEIVIINGFNYSNSAIEIAVEYIPEVTKGYTAVCAVNDKKNTSEQLAIFFHTSSLFEKKDLVKLLKKIRQEIVNQIGINPRYIIPLDKSNIPRTTTGKIQRLKIKESFEQGHFDHLILSMENILQEDLQTNFISPLTPMEETLVKIWQEVLAIEKIGINDNFFVLGGNSLLAIKIISRIRGFLGIELPLPYLFEHPTIQELVQYPSIQGREIGEI
jgi:acyl carrier protein